MTYRSSASYGKRQEYIAIAEFLKRGYDVYQTLVDDQGIDCVIRKLVDGTPRYIDIQIKARSKDCQPKDAARFAGMSIPEPRNNYLFFFYSEQVNTYWIIPSIKLTEKLASKNVKGKNIGKYHILLTGIKKERAIVKKKYEQYVGENGFKILEDTFKMM